MYLKNKENKEKNSDTERAYLLARQSEEANKVNKGVWGGLRRITNHK